MLLLLSLYVFSFILLFFLPELVFVRFAFTGKVKSHRNNAFDFFFVVFFGNINFHRKWLLEKFLIEIGVLVSGYRQNDFIRLEISIWFSQMGEHYMKNLDRFNWHMNIYPYDNYYYYYIYSYEYNSIVIFIEVKKQSEKREKKYSRMPNNFCCHCCSQHATKRVDKMSMAKVNY